MKKLLSYLLTPLFLISFGLTLLIFHPIQMISLKLGGYHAHKRSVEILNWILLRSLHLLGNRYTFRGFEKLPAGKPLIVISNHQSAMDIPPFVWGFRHHHPKFISKIELGRGIPSISYNLRHGGSALINRKQKTQSLREISRLGKSIEANQYTAVLFPEGTRTRTGRLKPFKTGGLHTLLMTAPSAVIIPFAIKGNYDMMKHGFYPMGVGMKLSYTVLDPVDRKGKTTEEIMAEAEKSIRNALGETG